MPVFSGCDLEVSEIPLRRINTRGRVRPTGRFASRKMKCCLPWESSNELAWFQRAELDPDVSAFYAQPLSIEVIVDGRRRSYVPDGVAVRRGCVEVHEVKPDADAATDDMRALGLAAGRHIALRGGTYGFALESTLKALPVYSNMRDVLRRLHRRVPEPVARRLITHAQDAGPLTVSELVNAREPLGGTFEDVLALVARGRLRLDLRHPFCAKALVWALDAFPSSEPLLPLPKSVS